VPSLSNPAEPLGYRRGLDGVRALAVLTVAGVHTHPRLVPGGSIGVDTFFVLSGFLITTLLLEELDRRDRIAFARFYARRALRLLPALFGLLAFVLLWALLVASPHTRHDALMEVLAAASYTRNLTVWSHVPGVLLGHTWSLAVEEQFYLVWPVLVALLVRPRRSARWLVGVFALCFVLFGALRVAHHPGVGLLFIMRPEALLLGAAVAVVRRDRGGAWTGERARRVAGCAIAAGGAGLVALAMWDGADSFFSVGYSLAAICAALLILGLVVRGDGGAATPFTRPRVVALGKVSYGFYLWHMPVLRWTDDRLVGRPALLRVPVGLAVALLATVVSYRLLERPAMRLKARVQSPVA
jgi:peptidoglycan/LPS O-acetylase OafA/YrhL